MAQIGSISVADNVNTQAIIELLKKDSKVTIGKEQITEYGIRYIPIEKN